MLSLLVLLVVLLLVGSSLSLLRGRRGGPRHAKRLSRAAVVVPLVLLVVLSLPFDRWLIAAISCGHQPVETSDFAAANSYTLPGDGTYSRYPIFDGFACNVSEVSGRHHNDLP